MGSRHSRRPCGKDRDGHVTFRLPYAQRTRLSSGRARLAGVAADLDRRPRPDDHRRVVHVYQGNVVLLRGKRVLKVPFNNLSWQDQQYVRQQLEAKGHPNPSSDRATLESVSTEPESPHRSSRPLVETPASPGLAGSRHASSESSPKRRSSHGPSLFAPAPASHRGSGVGNPPVASLSHVARFGRLTVEEWNRLIVDRLFHYTGSRDVPRRKSTSPTDWPDAKGFVRVQQNNVPILGAPDLVAPSLNIFGVSSMGEMFALVDQKRVVALMNPLSNTPDQSGLWYKVQMLDGKQGWIFAEPQDHQGSPIATIFAARSMPPVPTTIQIATSPTPSGTKPVAQEPTPSLGEALFRPLNDPRVSATQRLCRGIGIVIGGGLAVLVLIGIIAMLLLVAGGWRWLWWREQVRRIMDPRVFSRQRGPSD